MWRLTYTHVINFLTFRELNGFFFLVFLFSASRTKKGLSFSSSPDPDVSWTWTRARAASNQEKVCCNGEIKEPTSSSTVLPTISTGA